MWKKIDDVFGYSINECGYVRNDKNGKILKGIHTYNGYLRVCIGGKSRRIHRLVAEAFIPNPDDLSEVNHKDGDKDNNCADNLEWCTHKQNIEHAWKTGLHTVDYSNIKEPKRVVQMTVEGEIIGEYESTRAVFKKLGYDTSNISKACRGIQNTAYGYKWRYANL